MQKNLLIVEDSPEAASAMQSLFESEGYAAELVASGEEALSEMDKKRFDGVILDIMLPRIDGFEVCRRIKMDERFKKVPVICVTALDVHDIVRKCREVGAEEVILKPFEPRDLVNTVNKYFSI